MYPAGTLGLKAGYLIAAIRRLAGPLNGNSQAAD